MRFFAGYDRMYLRVAMPSAFEGVFMVLLSSVDIIMVGTLGLEAIAAVSIFTQPRMMLLCVTRSLASAVTLLTARLFGRVEHAPQARMFCQSLTFGAVVLGLLHIIFFFQLESLLVWMGAEPQYLVDALRYGNLAQLGVFLTSLATLLQAGFLGQGRTGLVLWINLWGNGVNCIVNALFIFGLGPFPALGVEGAAVGTVAGAAYMLLETARRLRGELRVSRADFLPDGAFFRSLLPVFGGVFSEQGFERVGMVLYTRMAAGLGEVPYAVHAIAMNFCDFYYCFAGGLGKASMVLAGQAYGRGDTEAWRAYGRAGLRWSLLFSTLSFVLTYVLRGEIFWIYTDDAASLPLGMMVLAFVAVVSFPEAHALVCAGILRGTGQTSAVAAYSFVSVTFLRPLVTAFLLYELGFGLMGVWLALAFDQSLRAICSSALVARLWRKKYLPTAT